MYRFTNLESVQLSPKSVQVRLKFEQFGCLKMCIVLMCIMLMQNAYMHYNESSKYNTTEVEILVWYSVSYSFLKTKAVARNSLPNKSCTHGLEITRICKNGSNFRTNPSAVDLIRHLLTCKCIIHSQSFLK